MTQKFRKKPVVIEAIQMPAHENNEWLLHLKDVMAFTKDHDGTRQITEVGLEIHTLEGVMTASPGDWIIRGVKGEYYPCKPGIFEATYETVME